MLSVPRNPVFRRKTRFGAHSGRKQAKYKRKKAQNGARNPSGDAGIALDMAVRGVIFSDNINYRTLESRRFAGSMPQNGFFSGNSPSSSRKYPFQGVGGVGFQGEEGIPIIELFTVAGTGPCACPRSRPVPTEPSRLCAEPSDEPLFLSDSFASAVIPAKAGIHFDFSPPRAATSLLLRGVWMRNSANSLFVFCVRFGSSPPGSKDVRTRSRKGKGENGFRLSPE